MTNNRKHYSPEEKVKIIRLHLIEKEPISDICERYRLNPTIFYRWQKEFFENGSAAFLVTRKGAKDGHTRKLENQVSHLKSKLANKDEVIAEIMASHVELKKSLGEI